MKKANTIERVRKTEKHTGKMSGMQSLSTSCTINPHCIERMKDGNSICAHCYASRMMKRYGSLERKLITNTKILATHVLTAEEIAALEINSYLFRFESFGDIVNTNHAHNYINIAKATPSTRFGLWSKNIDILEDAFDKYGKPSNVRFIYSMSVINPTEDQIAAALKLPYVDKVFCVFTEDYIEAHNIDINCGERKCIECRTCYMDDTVKVIREKLK